jgi:hypothetical protein
LGDGDLGGSKFKITLDKKIVRPPSQPMTGAVASPVIPAMSGSINRSIVVHAGLGIKQDPVSKIKQKGLVIWLKW